MPAEGEQKIQSASNGPWYTSFWLTNGPSRMIQRHVLRMGLLAKNVGRGTQVSRHAWIGLLKRDALSTASMRELDVFSPSTLWA